MDSSTFPELNRSPDQLPQETQVASWAKRIVLPTSSEKSIWRDGYLFGLGLLVLPFVFFPILGFGSATYSPAQGTGLVSRPQGGTK